MSLRVEYSNNICETEAGKTCTVDDFPNGVHLRIEGHKNGGYFGVSNAKPEGEKNGPNYRQVGFFVKNDSNIVENFMGRTELFEIKIKSTSWKNKKNK